MYTRVPPVCVLSLCCACVFVPFWLTMMLVRMHTLNYNNNDSRYFYDSFCQLRKWCYICHKLLIR